MELAASYLTLAGFQALAVVAPDVPPVLPAPLRRRGWALVPPVSIVVVVGALVLFPGVARALAALAAVAVPLLAVAAPALARGRRRLLLAVGAVVALPLAFAADGLATELGRTLLIVLACAPLGQLVVAAAPPLLVELGLVAMTVADVILVAGQQIGPASRTLHAAPPPAGLPPLQDAHVGVVTLGFGDLFLAAVLGALLAATPRRRLLAAAVTLAVAVPYGLLLRVVDVIPSTVPVLAGLLAARLAERPWRASTPQASAST